MICICRCHVAPDVARAFADAGVDVRNVIEAAVACGSCQNAHTPALLNTQLPSESAVPVRGTAVTVISPEGVAMSWDAYRKEQQKRADDACRENGEGPEC